ncbi:MAG: hypothetical protein INR71_09335 [Terriglobus roseus]|nr:hypothetical protein [Terriglobus roseus]
MAFLGVGSAFISLRLFVRIVLAAAARPGVRAGAFAVDLADFCGEVWGDSLGVL